MISPDARGIRCGYRATWAEIFRRRLHPRRVLLCSSAVLIGGSGLAPGA
jgi:hypothetical protein